MLNKWRNHFCHLLNVHGINDGGQTEIDTSEPIVPEPKAFKAEIPIEKLKRYKSLHVDQVQAQPIKA
jgi:hypothetical protein